MRKRLIRKALLTGLVLLVGLIMLIHQPVPAIAAPAPGRIFIGATGYDTLEAAIAAATKGDTLTLTGGNMVINSMVAVPAAKELTLDLGGNALISRIDVASSRMFSTSGEGAFTLTNGSLSAEDVDGNGLTGGAIASRDTKLLVENIKASGFISSGEGGVVYVQGSTQEVLIKDCDFSGNAAGSNGGAISIRSESPTALFRLEGNTISNNTVTGSTSSFGGGAYLQGIGKFEIAGNTIDSNHSVVEKPDNRGFYWSHGGGMVITSPINGPNNIHVVLEDNVISNNETQLFGAGIYFFLGNKEKDILDIRSGLFKDNHSGYAGGAIDYSVHGQPTMVLRNAIFTDNMARRGGAIWACPTAKTQSYTTLGGAIIGNHLEEGEDTTVYTPAGQDVRFEGSDTDIGGIITDNVPAYHKLTMRERTFLGDKVNWYLDNPLDRYQEGDTPLPPDDYTARSTSIGLYGEITTAGDWYERHKPEAQLIFIGNTAARRGGAISANSDIQIGEPGDVSVLVTKKWLDMNGSPLSEGVPEFVYARLIRVDEKGGEYPLEAVRLSAENGWRHTFTQLPGRGLVGEQLLAFRYIVREETALLGFETVHEDLTPPDGSEHNHETLITNRMEKVSISGSKTWYDNNNQDGKRPASITIRLLKNDTEIDSKTVTAADNWSWTFADLPKYEGGALINYVITEDAVPEYSTQVTDYNLANTRTPGKTSVQVTKAWLDANDQDGVRPDSVTVALLADSADTGLTLTLTEANHWTGTFTNLDMYRQGQLIVYSVEEVPVGRGYSWVTTGDPVTGYVLTNSRTPETIRISGSKTWDDQDDTYGVRPAAIIVNLYANGHLVPGKSQTVVPDASGRWAWSWEDLDKYQNGKEIEYEVGETKIPDYTAEFPDYETAAPSAYDITNRYLPDHFNIPVRKFWADRDNLEGLRPESVVIKLFANGEDTGKTVTLNPANRWSAAFLNLDRYDANGAPIHYRLEESPSLALYRVTYRPVKEMTVDQLNHVDARSGATIENQRTPETLMVSGAKTWDDHDDRDGKRPASITIRLHKNGTEIDSKTATAADGWAWSFVNLPKYEEGKLVSYTISEDEVEGYEGQVSGFDVTNLRTPETLTVSGAKTWNDQGDRDGMRPASITVRLHKNGTEIDSRTVTAADGWAWSFVNLPKYEEGKLVSYTITEDSIPPYTTQVRGFDLINTYVPPPRPTDPSYPTLNVPLKVSKVLKNGSLKGGEFTFQLKDKAGQVIAEAKNAADGSVTFPDRTFSRVVSDWIYTIQEVPGTDPRMSYDRTVYTVKISTRAVDGRLEASVSIQKDGVPFAGPMAFTNHLTTPPTGDKAFQAIALLLGASLLLTGGAYARRKRR